MNIAWYICCVNNNVCDNICKTARFTVRQFWSIVTMIILSELLLLSVKTTSESWFQYSTSRVTLRTGIGKNIRTTLKHNSLESDDN